MSRFVSDPLAATTSFFALDPVEVIDQADVAELGRIAQEVDGPARFNLHSGPSDDLHCMAILQPGGVYAQPRKHLKKSKVFHLICGEMVVVTFHEDGTLRTLHLMAPGETLIVRIAPGIFHTNFSLSEQAQYHEVISGPFDPGADDRSFGNFAPEGDDQESGRIWMRELLAQVRPDLNGK